MTTLLMRKPDCVFSNYGIGSSSESQEIQQKFNEAEKHQLEKEYLKFPTLFGILMTSNISQFEARVEEVRDLLLEKKPAFIDKEVKELNRRIDKLDLQRLLVLARLLGPLLENEVYVENALLIIRKLLKNSHPEVRYVALEAISFALGEVPRVDTILEEAKILLRNEESAFVRDFLSELIEV